MLACEDLGVGEELARKLEASSRVRREDRVGVEVQA